MTAQDLLWYVGYGSNTLPARLGAYLGGASPDSRFGAHTAGTDLDVPTDRRWLTIPHALYFAGVSARWGGSPAFVSLDAEPGCTTVARAYLVTRAALDHVAAAENAQSTSTLSTSDAVPAAVGSWSRLPVEPSMESHRGKYDALLRLADIDGLPAMTLTSSRVRERGEPSQRYLDVIREGLRDNPFGLDVENYLDTAVTRSATVTR
ncbi:MAG: hypothetical protein WBA00_00055 [Rhodococcus sp. (in: high G+C Gram-positive bacteria)]